MRLIGFDPGLQTTGWGIIEAVDNRLSYVADGLVTTSSKASLSERLVELHAGLRDVIAEFTPDEAAVEETFVNKNAVSTLKLGQARGIVLLVPALAGLNVAEYLPNLVKKTVVGSGHAQKEQVQMMVLRMVFMVSFLFLTKVPAQGMPKTGCWSQSHYRRISPCR